MSNFQDPPIPCPSTSKIFHPPSRLPLTWTFNFKRTPPPPAPRPPPPHHPLQQAMEQRPCHACERAGSRQGRGQVTGHNAFKLAARSIFWFDLRAMQWYHWGWFLLAPEPMGGFLFRRCANVWLGVVFGHGAYPIFFYKAGYRSDIQSTCYPSAPAPSPTRGGRYK